MVAGKGQKDRYTMLSRRLLEQLRYYCRDCRPQIYLFPSSNKKKKDRPLSYEAIRCVYEKARKQAGVKNGEGIHTLRHYAEFQTMPSGQHLPCNSNDLLMVVSADS